MINTVKLYAVKDDKVTEFGPPFVIQNDAVAVRQFGDLITQAKPETAYALHPEDFSIWFIGSMDCNSGELIPLSEKAVLLARGSDFVK